LIGQADQFLLAKLLSAGRITASIFFCRIAWGGSGLKGRRERGMNKSGDARRTQKPAALWHGGLDLVAFRGSLATMSVLRIAAILSFSLPMVHAEGNEAKPAADAFRTALIYADLFLEHETGEVFPEHPDRVRRLTAHLKEHPISERLLWIEPSDEIDPMPWIHAMHDADYVAEFKETCEAGGKQMHGSADTPVSKRSYEVAVQAVAGALTAVDLVMEGRVKNSFAALRPPGHHAMPAKAKGFCFFANAAIAARYAQKHHTLERVMIVDWDVHHGDGTQVFFLQDPTVYFFSTHQYPFYPGHSGSSEITGSGAGDGFNLNVPLAAGSGDEAVIKAYRSQLTEAFRKFKPQLLIISAGFDAHEDDPLGGLGWSSEVYAELTEILRALCREQGHERIVSLLEGGYSKRGITEGVRRHIEALEAPAKKP
jgi:acetoin utilization deacetylase AcuC-like enzyme